MKLVTTTCREKIFPITKDNLPAASDIIASWCFGSRLHIPSRQGIQKFNDYDAAFFVMEKQQRSYEKKWMERLYEFKSRWPQKKVILYQEGEAEYFLTRNATQWEIESGWIEVLHDKVDLVLSHNKRDAKLQEYFVGAGKVVPWKTAQDTDRISMYIKDPNRKERSVGISTYEGRAGGVLGVAVASKTTKNLIQINRTNPKDERDLFFNKRFGVHPKSSPQCGWYEWLKNMSNVYVYLHPMPAASAGRDTIACAGLGIPVVGNRNLDEQVSLFPQLGVECYDPAKMEALVTKLLEDKGFYNETREYALGRFHLHGFDSGAERANGIMDGLGWE